MPARIEFIDHPEDISCAFCGSFSPMKVMIENQHEGVGSVICEECAMSLAVLFNCWDNIPGEQAKPTVLPIGEWP